jgi:hypothetical protein
MRSDELSVLNWWFVVVKVGSLCLRRIHVDVPIQARIPVSFLGVRLETSEAPSLRHLGSKTLRRFTTETQRIHRFRCFHEAMIRHTTGQEAPAMMTAKTLPAVGATVRARSNQPLVTTVNNLVAVLDRSSAIDTLRQSLERAGVAVDRIDVLGGASGQMRLDTCYSGAGGAIRRRAHQLGLGPEAASTQQYGRELAGGNQLIVIRDVNRSRAGEIGDIVLHHGGRNLRHYGRFSVAILAP